MNVLNLFSYSHIEDAEVQEEFDKLLANHDKRVRPNYSGISKMYLEPCQTSMIERFCENS